MIQNNVNDQVSLQFEFKRNRYYVRFKDYWYGFIYKDKHNKKYRWANNPIQKRVMILGTTLEESEIQIVGHLTKYLSQLDFFWVSDGQNFKLIDSHNRVIGTFKFIQYEAVEYIATTQLN